MEELMGKNYQMVQNIERALMINPRPFYNCFGDADAVRKNIKFISDVDGINADDIKVSFKAAPEKFVRATILEIPECCVEMDSRYFVIAYIGHDYEFFSCELMEKENFALRCNEDDVVKLYQKTPSIDEIWEYIITRYDDQHIDGLYFSVLYEHQSGIKSYIIFDNNSEDFLKHWFGTTEIDCKEYNVEGIGYFVFSSKESKNVALFRNNNGKLDHVQYGDDKVLTAIKILEEK